MDSEKTNYPILEETGCSWSGICDYLQEESPFKTKALLHEINLAYNQAKEEEERLTNQLNEIKRRRASMVSCFIYVHKKIVGTDRNPLVFDHENKAVIITILEENKIN